MFSDILNPDAELDYKSSKSYYYDERDENVYIDDEESLEYYSDESDEYDA